MFFLQVKIQQMTRILTNLVGQDSIRSRPFPLKYSERIKYIYKRPNRNVGVVSDEYQKTPTKTFKKKEKPPFGLTIFKVCGFFLNLCKGKNNFIAIFYVYPLKYRA